MKPDQFTPEELEPILKIASDCGMILIGGQAINSWALLLEAPEAEPWKSLRPYTSQDADMLCSEIQMLKFAKTLSESGWRVEVFQPEKNEIKINVGAIRIEGVISGKKRILEMNLLRQLDGMSIREIEATAEDIPIKNHSVKVIDCLRLLESKTISLNSLDQTHRHDRKHLVLCCAALKEIFRESAKGPQTEALIANASRIIQNAEHQLGLDTLERHQVNLLDAIPWEEWRQSKHLELKAFAELEKTIRAGIESKIDESHDLKKWIESLNPKKEKPTDIQ